MVALELFVEGGGGDKALRTECRRGFARLLAKAGLAGRMPRIVACGSRRHAYDSYRAELRRGKARPLLLVDSEAAVEPIESEASPWAHVRERSGDTWEHPQRTEDEDLHVRIQCMERSRATSTPAPGALDRVGERKRLTEVRLGGAWELICGRSDVFVGRATRLLGCAAPASRGR